ncbi:MAG: quinone oxidoreductase family protein, partial [Alphaproteobacteria bacterium]
PEPLAAAVISKGLTPHYLHIATDHVKAGDTILVHAAAGGVGSILCQWAKHLGARVIGTVGSEEKAAVARRHGCDVPIVYSKEDFAARVRELTGGRGVPVVYDSVGKDSFEKSLACLAPRGLLVSFGTASGAIPAFDLFRLNGLGSLYVTSPAFVTHTTERGELLARAKALFAALSAGILKVEVGRAYPLAEARRAHADLEARRTIGSNILLP